jgi:hypothetical protein
MTQPFIVCSAVRDSTGQIVCGPRHFDQSMVRTIKSMLSYTEPWEQGFVDQWGNFLTREQAWEIAWKNGQIKRRVGGDGTKLYSENLY